MWTIVSYMDLHVQYASSDWSKALREWIPKVEAAESVQEYYMVLQRLAAKLNDSHVNVFHSTLRSTSGILPIQLRPIEGKAVVVGTIKALPVTSRPSVLETKFWPSAVSAWKNGLAKGSR